MNGNRTADSGATQNAAVDFRVRKVLAALQQSFRHDVSDLAQLVNLSVSHLSRLFKQETGVGLGEYILELRMLGAAQLLATTTEPVKRVASAAGYQHTSSFVRAFHSRFAVNPKTYRNRMQRIAEDGPQEAVA